MKPGPFRQVVLIGPRASGKSTLLPALAHALGLPAIDTDLVLARAVGMPAGEFLRQVGEPEFRRREAAVVTSVLGTAGGAVVALGGGAVLDAGVAAMLGAPDLLVVLLLASAAVLGQRQADPAVLRPSLLGLPLQAEVAALLQQRLGCYRQLADLELDTGALAVAQCIAAIVARRQAPQQSR